MRNAALHLYWNREKENRGEWKKDVMFSCCRNEKATELFWISLRLWRRLRFPLCPDIHPPDRRSPLPVCMLVFCLLPRLKEPLRATQHFSDPALSSHHMTRVEHTHTVTWSLNNSPFVPSNWGCWSRYNAMPCALPCWPSPNTHRWQNKHIHSKYDLGIYLTPTRLHSYRHTKEKYTPLI